jgi:hypothetical protein
VSFNLIHKGDEATLELNSTVAGWISAGYMEVVTGGEDSVGPGELEPDADECEQVGVEGGGPAGGEPGAHFGAGPHGSPAGVDQG